MFERILVPLDGSKTAEFVLPYVVEIALKFDSRIIVARVLEPDLPLYESRPYVEKTAETLWAEIKNRRRGNKCLVEPRVLMGNPAGEILNYISESNCNLIVMASRGETNYGPWPLGNIAGKILRAVEIPVLMIRKQASEQALTEKKLIKKILLPLDGSKLAEETIPAAIELSRKKDVKVVLFRVIEPDKVLTTPGISIMGGIVGQPELVVRSDQIRSAALEYLEAIKESMIKSGIAASIAIEQGPAADRIIGYSEVNSVDLIIISAYGLSGIGKWIYGGVTDKVLHAGDLPVMVIRPRWDGAKKQNKLAS